MPRSRRATTRKFRARMVADNLAGIEGLLVGLVGFGTIGRAVAQAFVRMGCEGLLLRSGDDRSRKGIDARANITGRAACDLRCGVAACAAAARDAEPDRRGASLRA